MRKSLFFTLFRWGRVPKQALPALESEGIVLLDEGLRGSVTLRDYRAPGRIHSYRKSVLAGSLVITGQRFAGFAFSKPLINIPLHDDRLRSLDISVPSDELLRISFDAGVFDLQRSGTVECRYHTRHASEFLELVASNVQR